MANTYPVSKYKSLVRSRLRDQAFDDGLLEQFAEDVNRDICNEETWPFLESVFSGVLTVNTSSYLLPDNFQVAISLIVTDPNNNAVPLRYLSPEDFDFQYPDPAAMAKQPPAVWTRFANTFIVGPSAPDQAYTLMLRYLRNAISGVTDASVLDVPDEFRELVVVGMTARALEVKNKYNQAQVLLQEYELRLDQMRKRLMTRQLGEDMVMGTGRQRSNWSIDDL